MQTNPTRRGQMRARRGDAIAPGLVAGCLALVASLSAGAAPLPPSAEAERTAAVEAARSGDYAQAIDALESLRAAHPENPALLYDLVAVLGWSENDARALELGLPIGATEAPEYVQLAVAKAARNQRRFDVAAQWYAAATAAEPRNVDARVGLLLAQADLGDRAGVESTLAAFDDTEREQTPVRLARAYALGAIGESFRALSAYGRLLDVDPDNRNALRGKALVLRSMLLPTQALELAEQHPGILTESEIARLRVDELAVRVRLTARTPYPDDVKNENAASMLAKLDEFLADNDDPSAGRALAFDRIVALADNDEAAEAIAAFEALGDDIVVDQPYVLGAVAKAYLQERRPRDALRALDAALAITPNDVELKFSRVYALLDLERYSDAFELTNELVNDLPLVHNDEGSAVVKGNEDRMRAELLAGIAEAYGDQLAAAQARFESLLESAPNNPDVRHELANVYRWRGWLDRSLFEYNQVLAVNEELLSARLGNAHAEMDAREYRAVESTLREVTELYPREPATEQLAERWRVHNERELDVTGSSGGSSGPTFGTDYYTVDARWFTRPKAYAFRGYVHAHDAFATYPEGDGRRKRIGFGAEYRGTRWTAAGELTAARDGGGEIGLHGDMQWRMSDRWALAGVLELDSDAVQLRAYRLGIESDLLAMTARYARDESASFDLGLRHEDYSDGNRLLGIFADGRYRIVNRPRSKLEITAEIATSAAERQNVPYYSPVHDASVLGGLSHEFRIYRRYERSLTQTVSVRAGRHDQSGFATGSIWSAGYELSLRLSNSLALGLGAERAGQFFDGEREHSTVASMTVNARF